MIKNDHKHNEKKEEIIWKIMSQIEAEEKLRDMSDTEVADLLLEFVWAEIDCLSIKFILLEEAIERLRKKN